MKYFVNEFGTGALRATHSNGTLFGIIIWRCTRVWVREKSVFRHTLIKLNWNNLKRSILKWHHYWQHIVLVPVPMTNSLHTKITHWGRQHGEKKWGVIFTERIKRNEKNCCAKYVVVAVAVFLCKITDWQMNGTCSVLKCEYVLERIQFTVKKMSVKEFATELSIKIKARLGERKKRQNLCKLYTKKRWTRKIMNIRKSHIDKVHARIK